MTNTDIFHACSSMETTCTMLVDYRNKYWEGGDCLDIKDRGCVKTETDRSRLLQNPNEVLDI